MSRLILASASPRRAQLLHQLDLPFTVIASTLDEEIGNLTPEKAVEALARQKAGDIIGQLLKSGETDTIVLGADTVVALDGVILGKPKDEADAVRMLQMLQGKSHQVYTGVCLCNCSPDSAIMEICFHEMTKVTMYQMEEAEIRQYVETGEPLDKAGAYGIQGRGAAYIQGIAGDYNNVVGLPIGRVYQELKRWPESGLLFRRKGNCHD